MPVRSRPAIEILGVFRHDPAPSVIAAYAHVLVASSQTSNLRLAKRVLQRAVLVEAFVHHATKRFQFQVGQGGQGMNSFAWDPMILTLDGQSVAGKAFPYGAEATRVTFWIHDFAASKPLKTPYGTIPLPKVSKMPARLTRLVPYEPVD